MRHQDRKSNERIFEQLDSMYLNLKLVGGNMHPEELQAKQKVVNILCSDKDTAVTVEKNLMGSLLIDSEINKNYGCLKRSLIKSMNNGNNQYPNIKATAYTMLCKYAPERIKNNENSTTMRNSPATGVLLY